jgi:threonine dehydratase
MSKIASPFKIAATKSWGAEVIVCEKRAEANKMAEEKQKEGYFFIHPSDNDDLICGEGSAALEAIEEAGEFDAIFAPCGGGGLISSCYLAASEQKNPAQVFGCEPTNANDAAISLREGKIFHFADSPNTIADGVRTLAVSPRCFHYLKKLAGILEISEEEILVWQKKFQEVFAMKIEPTSALAFAGAAKFLQKNPQEKNPKILVIISGGNLES